MPFLPKSLVTQLLDSLTQQTDAISAALSRQADAVIAQVELDRARLSWEKEQFRDRQRTIELEQQRAKGEDLPAEVQSVVEHMGGSDPVLKSQLMAFARTRLSRSIPPQQIAREIQMGDQSR